jgi:hypothetical protein
MRERNCFRHIPLVKSGREFHYVQLLYLDSNSVHSPKLIQENETVWHATNRCDIPDEIY